MTDRALIERFLEMMAAERGAARNTLLAYRTDLSLASEALGGRLETAGKEELSRLTGEWAALAPSSAARKASALRRFFAFLHEEGLREDDPSSALPRPVQRRPLPKVLGR
ncbi:MAG TPA: site-specific integrase, partial [Rhizorhapis sp.]|nr:site-specific integrase [Rhizorhapis sp.]